MSPLDQAREELLSAALDVVSYRLARENRAPSAYDDADAEARQDRLDTAANAYVLEKNNKHATPVLDRTIDG